MMEVACMGRRGGGWDTAKKGKGKILAWLLNERWSHEPQVELLFKYTVIISYH